jgi:hypothetical protein
MSNSTAREARIHAILTRIDAEAEAGYCSNWAETDETRTALIVTLADGTVRRYQIPA